MKTINLAISGCLGRMGQQLIKSSKSNKNFKLVTLTENRSFNKKIAGIKLNLNTELAFKDTDVIVDFTAPKCTLEILKIASKLYLKDNLSYICGELQKFYLNIYRLEQQMQFQLNTLKGLLLNSYYLLLI